MGYNMHTKKMTSLAWTWGRWHGIVVVILVLLSPSCDHGVSLVIPLCPVSMSFVLAVSPITVVVHSHITNSPCPPCKQGLAMADVGTVGVGTRHGCCFDVGGTYLVGWAFPLSSRPVVIISVLWSPSHPLYREEGMHILEGHHGWVPSRNLERRKLNCN
jgi:hypothetical protein